MRIKYPFYAFLLCLFSVHATGQQISAPEPQPGTITGTVTDADGDIVPGATVTIDGRDLNDHRAMVASDNAFFALEGLHASVSYHLTISAKGFADWIAPSITLTPGQQLDLTEIKLKAGAVETTVNAVFADQLALEQVKTEEKQRLFGVIPNFYVVYDHQFVPLTTKLKYQLAFRAATDVVTIGGAGLIAGIDQASDTPNYVQGMKGYGQRFGAVYANGFSDILIGGAVLPSLLHQDPRYFYQGTGTKKSRALHAISAPFIAKGDNGQWQFNYSSTGGDLGSSALSNLYYPSSNRGVSLVFSNALILTGGRVVNALAQEFILHRVTSKTKDAP
jgi:hypothetical protein